MNSSILIDVTKLASARKHPAIFEAFDNISPEDSVIIHNDHDPKPVYYQLIGERGHCFTWTYLAKGPYVWKVEIKKIATGAGKETIGQIVAKDIRKAEVFKKLGIDFCCGGKKTLEFVCSEKGLKEADVVNELNKFDTRKQQELNFENWKLSFLTDYIINQHHSYVRENEPAITELVSNVAAKHGDKNPELIEIKEKVAELLKELMTHMKKEEAILFPYIKKLEVNPQMNNGFNNLQDAIYVMERDHDMAGELIKDIKKLSNNYTVPINACNSYKLMMYKLEEFENDLFRHVHLENNILFPKAIALEKNV